MWRYGREEDSSEPPTRVTFGDRCDESIQVVHHSLGSLLKNRRKWRSGPSEILRQQTLEKYEAEKEDLDFIPMLGSQFSHVHQCVYVSSFPHSSDTIKTMSHFFGIKHFLNLNFGSMNGVRIFSLCDIRCEAQGFVLTTMDPDPGVPELLEELGITVHHIPLYDGQPARQREQQAAIALIQQCVDANEPILVHCLAGKGRSWTTAMLWYTRKILEWTPNPPPGAIPKKSKYEVNREVHEVAIGARFRPNEQQALFQGEVEVEPLMFQIAYPLPVVKDSPQVHTKLRQELFDIMYYGYLLPLHRARKARSEGKKTVEKPEDPMASRDMYSMMFSGRGGKTVTIGTAFLRDRHLVEPELLNPREVRQTQYEDWGGLKFNKTEEAPLTQEQFAVLEAEPERVLRAKLKHCQAFPTIESIEDEASIGKRRRWKPKYGSIDGFLHLTRVYSTILIEYAKELREAKEAEAEPEPEPEAEPEAEADAEEAPQAEAEGENTPNETESDAKPDEPAESALEAAAETETETETESSQSEGDD